MKARLFFVVMWILFLLNACSAGTGQPPVPTATALPASTETRSPEATATLSIVPATPTPAPTQTATSTATPTKMMTPTLLSMGTADPAVVPEERRFIHPSGVFSLVPPADWSHGYFELQGGDTDGWIPPGEDPARMNIGTILITAPFDIDKLKTDWEANVKQMAPDYTEVRVDNLTSDGGQPYLRWELTYSVQNELQHLVYAFYRTESRSLVVIFARPAAEGSQYDLLVDETLKTVRLQN